ncbi:acetylcholine receptor subunit alpha-type acr-16-like isoform X2 [Paramacrobiotus metropolitanus]|uniref:acetylcholine receptor subunit alpha-type acr-16-like isoform X2 n=1 Tax=Paramacrobiotus metropolitanus TaxID=2943436 RepID=UPI002445DE43|nr:acetylcholine receptor subunit alpha-type acr-16-like isoform X2 [Paramacrobiotus metropolitanus]
MSINSVIILLCCSAGLIGHTNVIIAASSAKTSALVRHLIAAEDVHVPPNADQPGQPVLVEVSLQVTAIQHDSPELDLAMLRGFLDLNWRDSRLTWEPQEHHNITAVRLPADRVWLPDITLYNGLVDVGGRTVSVHTNNRSTATPGLHRCPLFSWRLVHSLSSYGTRCRAVFPEERKLVLVQLDGRVTGVPRVTFPLSCNKTRNYYSSGEVHCAVKLASWMYDGSLVEFWRATRYFNEPTTGICIPPVIPPTVSSTARCNATSSTTPAAPSPTRPST